MTMDQLNKIGVAVNRRATMTMAVFSLLGVADTAFLIHQYARLGAAPLCGVGSGCYAVLSQSLFVPSGIFIGWIGVGSYCAFLLLAIGLHFRLLASRASLWLDRAAFAAVLVSAVLLGAEFLVVKRFCLISVLSGLFMLAVWYCTGQLDKHQKRETNVSRLPRPVVVLSALVIVLTTSLVVIWTAFQLRGEPGVAATIGVERITRDEMRRSPLVFQAERQLYEAEHDWLSQKLEQSLLQREANAREITVARLVESIQAETSTDALRSEFFQKLAEKYNARSYLTPPSSPIFDVDVSSANWMGQSNAPVKIVEFGDFQCPFTARADEIVSSILKEYGPSRVALAAVDFPLPFHTQATGAAVAARCAGQQGKYWEYRRLLFAHQKHLSEETFVADASALNLDLGAFRSCERSQAAKDMVNAGVQEGLRLGLSSTPTFFVNGNMVSGAQPIGEFRALIDDQLQSKKSTAATAWIWGREPATTKRAVQ